MREYPRIFVDPGKVEGGRVIFSDEDLRHIRKVLRLKKGDLLLATDGSAREYLLKIAADGGGPFGEVVEEARPPRESPLEITLVQALPKGDLMTQVVQKAVELGVTAIVPVTTSRTVASAKGEGGARGKGKRWQRVLESAVAQSGRTSAPLLHPLRPWGDFLADPIAGALKILLLEGEPKGLKELVGSGRPPSSVVLAVGPEGGWAREEVELAAKLGYLAAGLGPRTLRTETAGPAALGIIQFLYGDLGRGWVVEADTENGGEKI